MQYCGTGLDGCFGDSFTNQDLRIFNTATAEIQCHVNYLVKTYPANVSC